MPTYDELRLGLGDAGAMTRHRTHAVFGQVMGWSR